MSPGKANQLHVQHLKNCWETKTGTETERAESLEGKLTAQHLDSLESISTSQHFSPGKIKELANT